MIYYINHFHITVICNYNWVIDQIRVLYQQIQAGNREKINQAVELLNSAVEAVVDRIGTERHELSGRAKDQGSAAVFIALCIVVVVWGSILFF